MNSGFTYLKAKNYKSFNFLDLDMSKNGNPKKLISIYGENGSGKTNIINAFSSLANSIRTIYNQNNFAKMAAKISNDQVNDNILEILNQSTGNRFLSDCFKNAYNLSSTGNLILEYGFKISGKKGSYTMEFEPKKNDSGENEIQIVHEELKFVINKRITKIFSVDKGKVYLNQKSFKNIALNKKLVDYSSALWGKHNFLSIFNEFKDNNAITDRTVDKSFVEPFSFLGKVSFKADMENGTTVSGILEKYPVILNNLIHGQLNDNETTSKRIHCTEECLNEYLLPLYSNILSIYYKTEKVEDDNIMYYLYVKKMIGGQKVEIPFSQESKGTKLLIKLFSLIINSLSGDVVFVDEIDSGIHDLLMNKLITSMSDNITGQLIFTTHDTLLMKELNPESVYIIQSTYKGEKDVQSVSKTQVKKNNNLQKMYLDGFFSGIPYTEDVYFDEIMEQLNNYKEDLKHNA